MTRPAKPPFQFGWGRMTPIKVGLLLVFGAIAAYGLFSWLIVWLNERWDMNL
jgi:hypothetical protein